MKLRILAGIAVLIGSVDWCHSNPESGPPRPNIVIIFTDDQGYGDLGSYGLTTAKTPHLDRMAEEGTRFTSFYTQPVCGPARSALLTGRYPERSKGWQMPAHEVTFAELMQEVGYATACIGKWDVSHRKPILDRMPLAQGFDYYWGPLGANDGGRVVLYENNELIGPDPDLASLSRRYTDQSIEWIKTHVPENEERGTKDEEPFLLYLCHTMMHTVIDASPEFRDRTGNGLYADTLEELDHECGRLLAALDELGIAEDTLVIFTSDNGPWSNDQERQHAKQEGTLVNDRPVPWSEGPEIAWGDPGPLRGGKASSYEAGPRVPCLVRWPGTVSAGRVNDAIFATLDFLPTFARLCGFELPDDRVIDGVDQIDLLLGKSETGNRETYFYHSGAHGVRKGPWKLLKADRWPENFNRTYPKDLGTNEVELYHLDEDIGETTNLAAEHPDIVVELQQLQLPPEKDTFSAASGKTRGGAVSNRPGKRKGGSKPPRPNANDKPRKRQRVHSPHIVFFMADDLGIGDVQCYNPDSTVPTPHIDALAEAGTRFTDALIGYFWSDAGLWERDRNGESWISFFQSLPGESAGGRAWRKWKAENPDADENNFLAVIGRLLYSQAHAMIRKYDENHLIFGDRWHEIDMPDHVVRESLPFVDAIAIQPTSPEFNHAFFERIHEETGKPIYIADHVSSFATDEHPVTMGQKAKNADDYVAYYERYVTTALSRPYLIGFNKCQFQDQVGSGGMLKQGLLRLNARPYPTVEGVAAANRKALELAYADASGPRAATGESGNARSAGKPFEVTVDAVANGRFSVEPPVPEDGKVAAGTVLTLQAEPGPGFGLDSLYSAVTGFRKWTVYREAMRSPWRVTVDQDMRIGASFLPLSEWKGHTVTHDVIYAQPGVKPLKYDVFSPDGAKNLPGIVIIHGGGWSSNDENVMRGLARQLVRDGDYVVFSIDYRWIGKRDGDETPNTMVDLIEDVFGAIAHIQEHAAGYGLDPTRLAVTGDSAGGHLSAAAANMAGMIGDRGFGKIDGVFEYRPTYLPEGKTAVRVRKEISAAIQAAAPSYGIFGGKPLENHAQGLPKGSASAISPIKTIPDAAERAVPQLLLRGTKDWIKHENVQAYADALEAAGQRVEYVQPEGARHAFLDWKPDPRVRATFRKFGVASAATMKAFFDSVFEVETENTSATQ